MSSRSKRDKDVELASTRDFRSSVRRGVEVEATRLALRLRWEVESKEGGNVSGATVLKDLAVALVIVHSAGPDVIHRGRCRSDDTSFLRASRWIYRPHRWRA